MKKNPIIYKKPESINKKINPAPLRAGNEN